jgi:hypothetical protein
LALLCGVIAAGSAQAQPSTSPLSPVPTLPTLPVKPAEPSADAVALGRELVIASGVARSIQIIVPQLLDQIGTNVTQTRPDLIRDLNSVMDQIKPEFDKQTDDMLNSAGRAYATRLDAKQLKDAVDFFKSPAGVAYVGSQPQVMGDLISNVQLTTSRLSTDMMTRVREEMKKRGHEM